MNYSGNITDWHQYSSVQANISEVTSTDHNVNTNRLAFIPSVSPTSLNALNTEGYKKYQNESNFNSRHFQSTNNISNGANNTDNFPLPSMVPMQGYIGQYSSTVNRNSVMDNVKGPIDIRNGSMNTFNDDYRYRNNHMALPGQNSHLNGSNININTPANSIGSRNNNVCAVSSVRQGPTSFIPCKALCCNPNPNMGYQQWDKFGTYQSNVAYRENVRLPGYQTENRQYNEHNFRKDNFENKEMLGSIIPNTDPRRNFTEYKYNKDSMIPRSCPPSSGMIQNYPIQNYNYAAECQKYTYPVKEYQKTNNIGLQDTNMFKHQEQSYITQQKYNTKQGQYTAGNMLPKTVPTSNVTMDMTSSTQNSYYPTQFIRNMPTEFPRTCQKAFDNPQQVTTMQSPSSNSSRYHSYQQKIAMQRFSMENHLRELARIPGYQSHPKYKESVLRYREILKLQQSYGCQATVQHPLRIATSVNTVPSINLQFDQNGILINSNCLSDGFPKTQHTLNSMVGSKHLEKQGKEPNLSPSDLSNEDNLHSRQLINHSQKEHSSSTFSNNFQNQDQFLIHKCNEQTEFKIQENTNDNVNSNNVDDITTQQKPSKDFADKPDLDVRQFLANWDASEDEDDSSSNLPDVVLSNSTPLVVVEYESIDSTSKIPHNMDAKENISCPKQHEKISEEYSESSHSPPHSNENLKNVKECKSKNISKSENIIHCITDNNDEIPTIHIVDNLQINNILEVSNEQIIENLENPDSIPFYEGNANTGEVPTCEGKESNHAKKEVDTCKLPNQYNTESLNKDAYISNSTLSDKSRKSPGSSNNQKLNALETARSNSDEKVTNLQKQNSFTSEESHNTDDISLPDLPTTECTPISTTLNTPIHSDSEEPSGRVSSISSNPIEIIQNSPIISFTHSPIKIGSYEHLDDTTISKENTLLQFNLEEVNQSSNNNINVFENAVPNNFNKSDNLCKNDINEICKSNKSQVSSNKNFTVLNTRKIENQELNKKTADMCVINTTEYESELISTGIQKTSLDNIKDTKVEKFTTDKFQNVTHSSKNINYKMPMPIEISKCTLKNKLNENKQQHIISVDTAQNNSQNSEINIETKRQTKYPLVTKLQQSIFNDKNVIPSTSRENEEETHTLIQSVEKSTLSDVKNVLSIPNKNISTVSPDKSQNINAVPISTKSVDVLMSNKLNFRSSQIASAIKEDNTENYSKNLQSKPKNQEHVKNSNIPSCTIENSSLSNIEILSDSTTLHKTISTSDFKNNTEIENKVIQEKEDGNEFMAAKQEKSIAAVIVRKVHNQVQKSDELYKINTNINSTDVMSSAEEENVQSKSIEEKKLGLSKKEFNIDRINMINNKQKQDLTKSVTATTNLMSIDKCIDSNRSVKNNDSNIKSSTPRFISTRLQSHDFELEDFHELEKNMDLKNELDSNQISPLTGICSTSENLESEQQCSISKSFSTKNANSDFEIQVANVNLKFSDNDIRKEIVTLRDKRQDNLNNCSDGIKIEINVLCAERNITEKLLQQDHIHVGNEIIETSNNTTCEHKNTCLSKIKEYNILSHGKLDVEQENIKIDELNNHEQNKSPDIIGNKNIENAAEVQEEPLSLIVRSKTLQVSKEHQLLQEFSNENDIVLKDVFKKTQNDEKGINNYIDISQEAKSANIVNKINKQNTSSSFVSKSIDNLQGETISCTKNNNLFNTKYQESEPSNIVYSSAAFSFSSVNYMQNSINMPSFPEQLSKFSSVEKNKIKEPFAATYKNKEKKDDEDDSSCEKNDGIPNIVTIHVKTDNMNNEKFSELDFTNFDLFSNESNKSNDNDQGKWRRPITPIINQTLEECDLYGSTGGYVNPIFTSIEESNNRKEVPVYRTKDGKITYSPNPKSLFLENREKFHCTIQGHLPHKYNHPKVYTFLKKDKDINNYKEKASLESDTKITWSESMVKDFSQSFHENDNNQKHSHCVKYQGALNLKHYHPKIEKQYNYVTENEVYKEYNKYYSAFKCGEQKQHNNGDGHITYKDCFKSETIPDVCESHKENFKHFLDGNACIKENNIKVTEITELPEVYITCHNIRNNNYSHKSSHNDTSSPALENTSLGKIKLNETCDIKLKYCNTMKESTVPYPKCDPTGNECSLNQNNNITNEKSNTNVGSDKEFKPNLDQLKNTELLLERNHFKDVGCCINNVIKHDSSSEMSTYFNEKKIAADIDHIETENISVDKKSSDLQATSEISKYKRHHEINFSMKCEVHSNENFEEDFDNTRDILKYANTENILISKKDVLLTETLNVECPDSLKQLNSSKQREEIIYNSDGSNSDIEHTNFSLESEASKVNENENLNLQITEANVFYADSNISISEKEWKRLPSNCFKHDLQNMENDVISSNDLENEIQVIQEESMDMSQTQKSKISETISEAVIDESSLNETSNSHCQKHSFITTDHRYDTSFSRSENKFQVMHISQNKDEVTLSKPTIHNKNINIIRENNTDKKTENINVENITSINAMNNSKPKSIKKSQHLLENTNKTLTLKNNIEIITNPQDSLKILNSREKNLQDTQFNDCLCLSQNKISINNLYSSTKQQRHYDIDTYSAAELENTATLTSQKDTNIVREITKNDKENKIEEECSLSPPDITNTAYVDVDYSSISDCNANDKIVTRSVPEENVTTSKLKPELSPQPKIPKMIIRNTTSRSTTPVAEEVSETSPGFSSFIHNITKHSTFIIENEEDKIRNDNNSEISLQNYNLNNSRVPKMKIKFNDKFSRKDIENKNIDISFKRKDMKKTIPKVKIKKIKTEETVTQNDQTQSSLMTDIKTHDMSDEMKKREKIPKLKLKKNQNIALSSDTIRKRPNLKTIDVTVKKYKSEKIEMNSSQKYGDNIGDSSFMVGHEIKNKSLSCISEKIPKVIIKRASASAEFKCEFSESDRNTIINSAKWQPEVKLQRSQYLDNMVKNLKYCQISNTYVTQKCIDLISSHRTHKLLKGYRFRDKRHSKSNKFSRSSSVSDLRPTKCEKNEILNYSYSNSELCHTEASSILKKIEKHDEFSTQLINKYKFEKDPHNLSEECPQESYISDDLAYEPLCKYSKAMHINKDNNMDHTIVKKDIQNIENILKNNADNDLDITFNTNSTINVNEVLLQTHNDITHYNDNENKFSENINEPTSKLLKSDIAMDDSVDDDGSVIKLDSSDESQSTIEILPASPDIRQIQIEKDNNINNDEDEQLYSEDAIPTQFELELEVTDSNIDSVDAPLLRHELNSENINDSELVTWQLGKKMQDFDDIENYSQNCIILPTDNDQLSCKVPVKRVSDNPVSENPIETSRDNLCCNDLLMKEVLAAKEMLKKCLSMSKNGIIIPNSKSKLETSIDKNQDTCFTSNENTKTFLQNETQHLNQQQISYDLNQQKSTNKLYLEKSKRKNSDERVKTVIKCPISSKKKDFGHSISSEQKNLISVQNSHIISLKTLKRFSQSVPNKNISANIEYNKTSENKNVNLLNRDDHIHQLENKVQDDGVEENSSSKIAMISDNEDLQTEDNKSCYECRRKEDNMPILEPEISFNHDINSDRDSSRSPPVITSQEVITTQNEIMKCLQEEILNPKDEKDDNKKYIEKEYDMTVTDIVTQLAYHKKATIRHKRYCTLCEKWFPTTSRHRRHLAGYQHRHLELTQRRTIHALFILFTGKPCSKLLRTTAMRDDCSIGELTPLQIAVQDLAKCMDSTKMDLLIQKNVNK